MILNCRFLSAFEKATAASPPMVFSSWFTSVCYAARSGNHWSLTEQLHQTRDLMLLNSIEDSSFAIEVRCYLKYRYCISYPPRWIIIIIIIITCIIVIYLLVLSSSSASAHYYHHHHHHHHHHHQHQRLHYNYDDDDEDDDDDNDYYYNC